MSLPKKLFRAAGHALPLKLLVRASGLELALPYQHTVSDEYLPHIRGLYAYKNTRQFTRDLDWLLQHFAPVHPHEIGRRKGFLLTFDDGFREVHDVIAPILLRKGVPALFFINPAFIGNRELFYRCKLSLVIEKMREDPVTLQAVARHLQVSDVQFSVVRRALLDIQYPQRQRVDELEALSGLNFSEYLRQHQPFLTEEQVESLRAQGFVFGGHSWDHPNYRYLESGERLSQTLDSIAFAAGNEPHRYFAFPHEDAPVPQSFFGEMKQRSPQVLLFGTQNQRREDHNRILHRFNAEDPAHTVQTQLRTALLYRWLTRRRNVKRTL